MRKKNRGLKVFGGIALATVFILIITASPKTFSSATETIDPDSPDIAIITFEPSSIISTDIIFTESDNSLLVNFLDENNLPFGSENIILETNTILFDSDQVPHSFSEFLPIPSLSVSDPEGRSLDLGSIQTGLFLKLQEPKSFVNVEGKISFFLDDDLIATKRIWASDQSKSNTIELSIVSMIPPSQSDRGKAFTFTISDEGRDWLDKEEHFYRVVINELKVSTPQSEEFFFSGEFLAYELVVTVDETKKIVLDDENNAISIFKSDSTLSACAIGWGYDTIFGKGQVGITTPIVQVYASDTLLGSFSVSNGGSGTRTSATGISGNPTFGHYFITCNESVNIKIPRGTDVTFKFPQYADYEAQEIIVSTPLSQHNYVLQCKLNMLNAGQGSSVGKIFGANLCASNFGYAEFDLYK